jgi:hypothetical protein
MTGENESNVVLCIDGEPVHPVESVNIELSDDEGVDCTALSERSTEYEWSFDVTLSDEEALQLFLFLSGWDIQHDDA